MTVQTSRGWRGKSIWRQFICNMTFLKLWLSLWALPSTLKNLGRISWSNVLILTKGYNKSEQICVLKSNDLMESSMYKLIFHSFGETISLAVISASLVFHRIIWNQPSPYQCCRLSIYQFCVIKMYYLWLIYKSPFLRNVFFSFFNQNVHKLLALHKAIIRPDFTFANYMSTISLLWSLSEILFACQT